MEPDFSIAVIEATVMIEQDVGNDRRAIGTGFLVADRDDDGQPRTVLVTANHVLSEMSRTRTRIGLRVQVQQDWTYAPVDFAIRDRDGRPLWTAHPSRDVAAIQISVPAAMAQKAIPLAYLADDSSFDQTTIAPGEEFMALGYPRGLSANVAGFPILRSARLASYPLGASTRSPTFLLDFSVFPGNSGGPVLLSSNGPDGRARPGLVAGLLTQQVEVERERMDIGIVTHARFVRETLGLLGKSEAAMTAGVAPPPNATHALANERITP